MYIKPLNYTTSNGNDDLPELNFNPTKMYVWNDSNDRMQLKYVLGKYAGYYLATDLDSWVMLKSSFNIEPFRFAIKEDEIK